MVPPTNSTGRRAGNRNRALAAVGGAVAFGGLAWYVYNAWTSDGRSGGSSGSNVAPSSSSSSLSSSKGLFAGKKNGPKPSLSISFPPTFSRSPKSLRLLAQLLASLSSHYTVTLIVPSYSTLDDYSGKANGGIAQRTLETVKQMSELLSNVQGFDVRRILEYSSEDGRLSLARALACDGHCEVMLQAFSGDEEGEEESDALFDDEEESKTEDGDRTPRASSPAPSMRASIAESALRTSMLAEKKNEEDSLVTALEHYHAEVARIRKSSGLLIFLLLPVQQKMIKRALKKDMWSLDVENVLKPFLMPGQRDLSARVPGVKVVDARIAASSSSKMAHNAGATSNGTAHATQSSEQAWIEAAQRVGQLSKGWS